jgi:predicted phage terminase large subunit-like protein
MPLKHTNDQNKALELLGSDARHILLRGGARSGKTVLLVEATLSRALMAKYSRHAILRFRANSLKSITGPTGTMNFVLGACFPPEVLERSRFNKQEGFLQLPNKSEIWFGGLDDKERVEKILGNEYATVFINEASQVPYASFNIAMTRLAQVVMKEDGTPLRQKAYLDANPPPETHWLHRLFEEKKDPDTRRPLANPNAYTTMQINPEGNKENLDPAFLESLRNLPERQRKRFYLGQYGDAGEAALWTSELLDEMRILDASRLPNFVRTLVIIDPSGADDVEDTTADEIGIGVISLGTDGVAYVLEDLTIKASPAEWGKIATDAYDRHEADAIVGESNFGGAMVRHVVQTAKPGVPYREVTASRGKHLRAEPVSALSEQGKVKLVGRFPELEDECCAMTTAGYTGSKSPNRLDWMVWGVTALFPSIISAAKVANQGIAGPRVPRVNLGHSRSKARR